MDIDAVDSLRLAHARLQVEQAAAVARIRSPAAEALQKLLWLRRDDIVQMALEREAVAVGVRDLVAGLTPFARCADVLAEGHNPVLVSLPSPGDGRRTFVQLRPEHFRAAKKLVRIYA